MIWSSTVGNIWWVEFYAEISDLDWHTFLDFAADAATRKTEMCSLVIHQNCRPPTTKQLSLLEIGMLEFIDRTLLWRAAAAVASDPEVAVQLRYSHPIITPFPFQVFVTVGDALTWIESVVELSVKTAVMNDIRSIVPQKYWPKGLSHV